MDKFLNELIDDATRSYIQKIIDNGLVEIQGKKITKSGNKLKGTETIVVNIPEDEVLDLIPEDIPLDIIYEDSDIVVINKSPNLVVHPAHGNYTGTLVNALLYHIKDLSTINDVHPVTSQLSSTPRYTVPPLQLANAINSSTANERAEALSPGQRPG